MQRKKTMRKHKFVYRHVNDGRFVNRHWAFHNPEKVNIEEILLVTKRVSL